MFTLVLRSLSVFTASPPTAAGRFKAARLFVPGYRTAQAIRLHACRPGSGLARRRLARLIETPRRAS